MTVVQLNVVAPCKQKQFKNIFKMCFIIREERSVKTLCNPSNDEKKYELKSGLHVRPKTSYLAIRAISNVSFSPPNRRVP
jgi:hypothetical protein